MQTFEEGAGTRASLMNDHVGLLLLPDECLFGLENCPLELHGVPTSQPRSSNVLI